MRDIQLSPEGDIFVARGDLPLTDSIEQRCRQALLLFKGEWLFDEVRGIPWWDILGHKFESLGSAKSVIRATLASVVGVVSVASLDLKPDRASRTLDITFVVESDAGRKSGSVAIQ